MSEPAPQPSDADAGGPAASGVDAVTVAKVSKLARIRLGEDETVQIARRMADILGYVDRLKSVDVSGVEPMAHPADAPGPVREDRITEGLPREAALSNAPRSDGETFLVPQVLDADS